MDLKEILINFLKYQPEINGVPLKYIIRDNIVTIVQTNTSFLDYYVDRTPPIGRFLNADASKVHSYIVGLISENVVAKHKILPHKDASDGHVD